MCRSHYLEKLSGAELELSKSPIVSVEETLEAAKKDAAEDVEESEEYPTSKEESEEEGSKDSEEEEEEEELGSTWQCHLCGQDQDGAKKRCGNCRAWKGGTRDLQTSPKKKSKKKNSTLARRPQVLPNADGKCIVKGCEKWGQGHREGYMCRRHNIELNKKNAKSEAKSQVQTKTDPPTDKSKIGPTGKLRTDLCSVKGCTKYRQKNNDGKCRKHYLESLSSGDRKSASKANAQDTGANNVQPAVQILVTATGEMVTTPRPSSAATFSSPRELNAKLVDAVDSGWKRSLQQLVSYHRKNNGRDPPAGSTLHKWFEKQAMEYSRRQKRYQSELTKGHVILLEQKAGFLYGGKMDKRKLDEMKSGASVLSAASPTTDRPKKKARRR
jgi:hypothetical protein